MNFTQSFGFIEGPYTMGVPSSMDYVDLNGLTDEVLLARSLQTPSAFEILVARYQRDFLERATFIVKSRDEAEDVVQDTFVRIYRFAPRFEASQGSFKSWAMTILMNVARTRYQKRAKEWLRTVTLEPEHYESLAAPSGDEALFARDTIERLLKDAPPDVAHLVRLVYFEGLTYEEIGNLNQVSTGAIKTRVHRARKVLERLLKELEV